MSEKINNYIDSTGRESGGYAPLIAFLLLIFIYLGMSNAPGGRPKRQTSQPQDYEEKQKATPEKAAGDEDQAESQQKPQELINFKEYEGIKILPAANETQAQPELEQTEEQKEMQNQKEVPEQEEMHNDPDAEEPEHYKLTQDTAEAEETANTTPDITEEVNYPESQEQYQPEQKNQPEQESEQSKSLPQIQKPEEPQQISETKDAESNTDETADEPNNTEENAKTQLEETYPGVYSQEEAGEEVRWVPWRGEHGIVPPPWGVVQEKVTPSSSKMQAHKASPVPEVLKPGKKKLTMEPAKPRTLKGNQHPFDPQGPPSGPQRLEGKDTHSQQIQQIFQISHHNSRGELLINNTFTEWDNSSLNHWEIYNVSRIGDGLTGNLAVRLGLDPEQEAYMYQDVIALPEYFYELKCNFKIPERLSSSPEIKIFWLDSYRETIDTGLHIKLTPSAQIQYQHITCITGKSPPAAVYARIYFQKPATGVLDLDTVSLIYV